MPLTWRNRIRLQLLKKSNILKYIDELQELTNNDLKYIIKYKNDYHFLKSIYLTLKYKFKFVPKFEYLSYTKGHWTIIFLEVIDIPNNKTILYDYIKEMEVNNHNIKFICKIMKTKLVRYIYYDQEIIDYIFNTIKQHPKMVSLLEIIINRNQERKTDVYLDTIINGVSNKYIYQFNNQKQLFNYIDKIKFVSAGLLSKNKKLFTNEELYNFIKGKNYKSNITGYILRIKKPTIFDIKLLEISTYFDIKKILPVIKILNKYSFLYKSINFDNFFYGKYYWSKAKIFEIILHIVQKYNFDINYPQPYRGFLKKN